MEHDRAPTLRDVPAAAAAGAAAVWKVISGRDDAAVTASRIRAAIDELGLQPSWAAQRLRLDAPVKAGS
ncbi:MAG: hypothetical protein HHJ13_10925 [Phycicoccus sp.]|nr:hypothetical protein [Phycicoccus sp.]